MALEQRLIPLADETGWDAALAELPHSFAHTHAYTKAIADAAAGETFLYTAQSSGFAAACPFTVRHYNGQADIVSPYGFCGFVTRGSYGAFTAEYKAFMAGNNYVAGYIVQHPLGQYALPAATDELFYGKQCFLMDLRPQEDVLLAAMASDHRSRLRQWCRQQPEITTNKTALTEPFLALYPEAMKRAGAKEAYFFSAATLRKLISYPQSLLVGALGGDGMEAISLFLYQGNYAEYYLNACTETGKRHARGLVWKAAQWLKAHGVQTLNLGCGIHEGDALEEFKSRFGVQAQRFNILKQVYQPEVYAALCQEKRMHAEDKSGFFPAYYAA